MPKFNHVYTLPFEITSRHEEGEDLTGLDLRKALFKRLDDLSDDDMLDACEPVETDEIEDDEDDEDEDAE